MTDARSEGSGRHPDFIPQPVPTEEYESAPGYFGRPVIKEHVWIWAVPLYFHVGGAMGAAAALGAAAQVAGTGSARPLVERCRRLAAAGGAAGTVLLIADLGRPERFLNMLRVFRPTSPLSVGSWVLAVAGPLTALSALGAGAPGAARRLGDAAGLAAGLVGLPLSGYTAVLLAQTAVPVWQETGRTLPLLFVSSAAASAAAALELGDLKDHEARIVRRFALLGRAAEALAAEAVERDADRIPEVGHALHGGRAGLLWRLAKGLGLAALALTVLPRSSRRRRAAGALGTTAGIALRFAVVSAGTASARDPQATFAAQGRAGPHHR